MSYKAYIQDGQYYRDWELTGRVKYKKFDKSTTISLEIKYKDTYNTGFFTGWQIRELTQWLDERQFYFVEIPEETIYQCPK